MGVEPFKDKMNHVFRQEQILTFQYFRYPSSKFYILFLFLLLFVYEAYPQSDILLLPQCRIFIFNSFLTIQLCPKLVMRALKSNCPRLKNKSRMHRYLKFLQGNSNNTFSFHWHFPFWGTDQELIVSIWGPYAPH